MDKTNDISQGRLSGGGVQTRSRTAPGTRRTARAKEATPQGPRGSRTPASTARIARNMVTDAEATEAAGKAVTKACTPEPVNVEGLGEPVRPRCSRAARATDAAPAATGTGHDAPGALGNGATAQPVVPNRYGGSGVSVSCVMCVVLL